MCPVNKINEESFRHILIVEVSLSGHHPVYLEKIAEAHLKLGRTVTVLVSDQYLFHSVLVRLSNTYSKLFSIVTLRNDECAKIMKSKLGYVGQEIALWRSFKNVYRRVNAERSVDFVFLPYADYCLNAIGLLGSPFGDCAWSGICMRPAFHYKDFDVIAPSSKLLHIKRMLFNRVMRLSGLTRLFTIDDLLVGYILKRSPGLEKRLCYLPDPAASPNAYDMSSLRQHYGIPSDVKVVLVYGSIDRRKGIFELLDALESSPQLNEWHVLVVGQQAESVRDAFTSLRWSRLKQSIRIHEINKFVSDDVEHRVFALCDVVWVAYLGHYTMSGVIVRAGMYRKPVIACEEGLIGWYAKNKRVGVTTQRNSFSIVSALILLSNSGVASKMGNSGFAQFGSHSWSKCLELLSIENPIYSCIQISNRS